MPLRIFTVLMRRFPPRKCVSEVGSADHVARSLSAYNQAVTDFGPGSRSAILSTDTSADVERLQIEGCRRMSPLEKARIPQPGNT